MNSRQFNRSLKVLIILFPDVLLSLIFRKLSVSILVALVKTVSFCTIMDQFLLGSILVWFEPTTR